MTAIPTRSLLFVAALAAASSLRAGAPFQIDWHESTPAPSPRAGYADGAVGGRLILIGGTYWEGEKGNWTKKVFCATVDAFDPASQRWEALPDAPVTVGYPASAEVGGTLYVLGGFQNGKPSAEVRTLSKSGGHLAWSLGTPLPGPRLFDAATVVGKTIYVLGGTTEFEPYDAKGTCCTSRTATRTLWAFDTAAPSAGWKTLAPFPEKARWSQRPVAVGRSIFVFGGRYQARQEDPMESFKDVWRYDVATDRWSRVADMPESLVGAAAVAYRGQIVLVGSDRTVMAFDPVALKFRPLQSLPEKASVDDFVQIGSVLVGATGETTVESPRRRSPWTFVGR